MSIFVPILCLSYDSITIVDGFGGFPQNNSKEKIGLLLKEFYKYI